MIYGYARVSTPAQNIQRQIKNLQSYNPEIKIYQEKYTGTRIDGRREFNKLLNKVSTGDVIVFDEVSRMARNKEDGVNLYFELSNKGIELIFLKEPHINTSIYKEALQTQIAKSGNTIADIYIDATNEVLKIIAKQQIELAFDKAQSEVQRLRERTKEGIEVAKRNGKTIGRQPGKTPAKIIENQNKIKDKIQTLNKSFGGPFNNKDTWEACGITKPTFYKYKNEILKEYNE